MHTVNNIEHHYLYPSKFYVSRRQTLVDTVLGSCISVCLYDPILKHGGINHYMLPLWNGEGIPTPKYGNIANEKLLEAMLLSGSKKELLVAKVFGGANQTTGILNIGQRNYDIALSSLDKFKIKIVAQSVLGEYGRKIIFNTSDGSVMMKMLNRKINE